MVVDISSSRRLDPNGWQMSPGVYAHAWRLLSIELQKWGFQNYVIDIENESNCGWGGRSAAMTTAEAIIVRGAIRANLPAAPITASVACHISPENAASLARAQGMSFIGYHDPRTPTCVEDTLPLALRCKAAAGPEVKVYFQEPAQIGWGNFVKNAGDLLTMCRGAEAAKIAAWCFHSDASFKLNNRIELLYKPEEREFLNRLK